MAPPSKNPPVARIGAPPPEHKPITFQPLAARALREMTAQQLSDHLDTVVQVNDELWAYYNAARDMLQIRYDIEQAVAKAAEGAN